MPRRYPCWTGCYNWSARRKKGFAEIWTRLPPTGTPHAGPLVENLGDGIYELRTRVGRVNYRILFSYWGRTAVLLSHGFTKEREIPAPDLQRALRRKLQFELDPAHYYAEMEL